MDLRQLRYALAVAEHLGFERAARALGVSQSVVSRGVGHLEDELGIILFERSASGVRVTQPGRAFLRRVQRPYNDLAEQWSYAGAAGRAEVGCLAVSFYQGLSRGILREILQSHRRQWPEIMLHFCEEAPVSQLIALRERQIDIAFLPLAETAAGAESEKLWDEPMFVAVPQDHALASKEAIGWEQLRSEHFIVRSSGTGPIVYAWLTASLGVEGYAPNIDQHDVSRSALFGLVACGYGLTPCSVAATGAPYPGIVFVPIVGERSSIPILVAWLAESFNPVLQRFLAHARQIARSHRIGQA